MITLFLVFNFLYFALACDKVTVDFRIGSSGKPANEVDLIVPLNIYRNYLIDNSNRQSFQYRDDKIIGFLWSGSYVNNLDLTTSMLSEIEQKLRNNPLKETIYIEYIGKDCRSTAGLILTTTQNSSLIQEAVKKWSVGQHLTIESDISYSYSKTMCFERYKTPLNDPEAGECFYFQYNSSTPLTAQCNTPTDYLKVYNDNSDLIFFDGDQVCCSEGKKPKIEKEITFNYYVVSDKTEDKKRDALKLLDNFEANTWKQQGDVIMFPWLGERVQDFGNSIAWLKNEIQTSNVPDFCYIQYFEKDPEKCFGIAIDSKNNLDNVQKIVKTWSTGKTYEVYNGFKKFQDEVKFVSPRHYADLDVGHCETVEYDGKPTYFLEKFNPYFNKDSTQPGTLLCASAGKNNIDESECVASVITKSGSCDNLLESYDITIERLQSLNKDFKGCDKVKFGDYLCVM